MPTKNEFSSQIMKRRFRSLAVAMTLLSNCHAAGLLAADPKLAPGEYTGAGQVLVLKRSGENAYGENLGIRHIEIVADGSLLADFPDMPREGVGHLQIVETDPRTVWSAIKDGKTFQVTAIPFSQTLYAFRLEVLQAGELIGGEQQFFALSKRNKEQSSTRATYNLDQQIVGIGVALGKEGQNVVVKSILPDSPAAHTKDIHVGDRIIAVAQDKDPAVQLQSGEIEQAVSLIRGAKGTTVRLTIVPSGADNSQARVVSLVRGELKELARWGDGVLLTTGTKAPDIEMIALTTKKLERLSDYAGKIVVLEFWSTWCAPCQRVMADLQTYFDKYPDWKNKVVLIAASVDDNADLAIKHLRARKWDKTHNVWLQADAIKAYHVNGIPTAYVIDEEGRIVAAGNGDIPEILNRTVVGAQPTTNTSSTSSSPKGSETFRRESYTLTFPPESKTDAEQIDRLADAAVRGLAESFPDWDVPVLFKTAIVEIGLHAEPTPEANEGTTTLHTGRQSGHYLARLNLFAPSRHPKISSPEASFGQAMRQELRLGPDALVQDFIQWLGGSHNTKL